MKNKKTFRIEKDSMGSMQVPEDALYGPQTQRAVENFPISNIPFNVEFINSVIIIKRSAAIVNHKLGLLDEIYSKSIVCYIGYNGEKSRNRKYALFTHRYSRVYQKTTYPTS